MGEEINDSNYVNQQRRMNLRQFATEQLTDKNMCDRLNEVAETQQSIVEVDESDLKRLLLLAQVALDKNEGKIQKLQDKLYVIDGEQENTPTKSTSFRSQSSRP